MDTLNTLINLGLSNQEAAVYITTLKLGAGPASAVAKETGLKRTTVYPILKSLAKKGFVSVAFKGTHRQYQAQRPQKLAHYYERQLEAFNSIIPSLNSLEKKQAQSLGLRFIETRDELKRFYDEILSEYKNKSYYIISSAGGWEGIDPEFFVQYRKDRGEQNIKTKLILTADSAGISPRDPELLRDVKFLPAKYHFRSTIDIYKDKVLIVSPELTSLAVVIAIPAMTDVFKAVFEILWDYLDKI